MSGTQPQGGPYGPQGPQYGQTPPPQQPGYGPSPSSPQPGQPSGPYPAYGPGRPPGQPGSPKKPGGNKPLIIVAASVLVAIILGVAGGVFLLNHNADRTGPTTGPGTDPSSTEAPATARASDAVQAYLTALAAGNADQVLALSTDVPTDTTFLTSELLQTSLKQGAITGINVPAVDDEYAYRVAASYKIGDQAVNEEFSVKKAGDAWKVSDAWVEMNLSYARNRTLPMLINGTEVKTDKVLLFPGTYAFTTGNKRVDYGTKSTIAITGPTDYPSASELEPTLTETGYDEVIKQGKAALNACLKQKKLAPAGCPNQVKARSNQKVDESTIQWAVKKSPWDNLKLRLDYDDPSKVRNYVSLSFTLKAEGTEDGRRGTFNDTYVSSVLNYLTADLTEDTVKVTFTN